MRATFKRTYYIRSTSRFVVPAPQCSDTASDNSQAVYTLRHTSDQTGTLQSGQALLGRPSAQSGATPRAQPNTNTASIPKETQPRGAPAASCDIGFTSSLHRPQYSSNRRYLPRFIAVRASEARAWWERGWVAPSRTVTVGKLTKMVVRGQGAFRRLRLTFNEAFVSCALDDFP